MLYFKHENRRQSVRPDVHQLGHASTASQLSHHGKLTLSPISSIMSEMPLDFYKPLATTQIQSSDPTLLCNYYPCYQQRCLCHQHQHHHHHCLHYNSPLHISQQHITIIKQIALACKQRNKHRLSQHNAYSC